MSSIPQMDIGLHERPSNLIMENVCRVCRDGSVTLVEIFTGVQSGDDDEDQEKNLAYVLSQCANCQVTRDDLLPKQICLSCVLAAQNAFRFKKTCEQSYQHFCQLLERGREKQRRDPPVGRRLNDNDVLMEGGLHVIDVSCIKIEPFVELQENDIPISNVTMEDASITIPSSEDLDNRANELFPHVCQYCTKGFRGTYELNNHIRCRHTGERPFKCPHCPKDFSVRIYLRNHLRVHTGERPYKCPHCPNAFTLSNSLKAHIRKHGDGRNRLCSRKLFRCDCCAASFREHFELRMHKQLKHRINDTIAKTIGKAKEKRPQSSIQRSKVNAKLQNLGFQEGPVEIKKEPVEDITDAPPAAVTDQPNQQVDNPNRYRCEICDMTFQYRYAFTNHMRYHMKRPFACPDPSCSLGFQTELNLRQHQMRFHASDWPFQCKECPKGFYTNYKLKLHMRSHTGERPFECPHCLQRFTQKQNLNRHITRRHSQAAPIETTSTDVQTSDNQKKKPTADPHIVIKTELPEQTGPHECHGEQILPDQDHKDMCHICGKHFSDTFTLNRHVSGHTGFQCPHCPKSYTQSNNLKAHILCHHEQSSDLNKPANSGTKETSKQGKFLQSKKSKGKISYRCKWCPIAFREQHKMVLHMQQKHKKRLKQSSIDKEPPKANSPKKPVESEMNNIVVARSEKEVFKPKASTRTHKCSVCGKPFTRRFSFIQHIRTHKPPLNCSLCSKQFNFYPQLRIHMRLHTGGRFQCAHCSNSYSRKDNLVKHMRKHKNETAFEPSANINDTNPVEDAIEDEFGGHTDTLFNCLLCSKSFRYKYNLRLHKLMKHGINEKTNDVENQTMNLSGLEQDTNLKLRNRPGAGAYEELEFEDSDVERRNINKKKTMSIEKPIVGEQMPLPQTPTTEDHLPNTVDSLTKSYVCPYCCKRYVRKESLTIHMRCHTGERPYKCSYCDLSFSSNNACKRHLRGHTGDLYRCDKCPKVYMTRSDLRFHKTRKHRVSIEEPIVLTKRLIVRLERIKLPTDVKIEPLDTLA